MSSPSPDRLGDVGSNGGKDEMTRLGGARSKSEQNISVTVKPSLSKVDSKSTDKIDSNVLVCESSLVRVRSMGSRTIRIEEVAPQESKILGASFLEDDEGHHRDAEKGWIATLNIFSSKHHGKQTTDRKLPRSIRRYYKEQDELIKAYELVADKGQGDTDVNVTEERRKRANRLAKISFVCNFALLIGKAVAAGLSGSLSVITSVIDSAVDLVSGVLMWCSGRAMKQRDPYNYPQGRTKLEPVAIVILSVIMALASFQMILESTRRIIGFIVHDLSAPSAGASLNASDIICISTANISEYVVEEGPRGPVFGTDSIVICAVTIVTKLVLFIICRRCPAPSAQALAQDHRNDVLSNSVAVACGLIGYRLWKYADSIGAIVISMYIIISWCITGWSQIKMLTGHTARPEFLKKITWISVTHDERITHIETVRAFHFGNNFLVEVDIVLPETMSLLEAHDIGETLQMKLEKLEDVERAFVHLDYDIVHDPVTEHKVV